MPTFQTNNLRSNALLRAVDVCVCSLSLGKCAVNETKTILTRDNGRDRQRRLCGCDAWPINFHC